MSDEISRRDNILQPSDSSENDQQMSNFDQGSEIDGELNIFSSFTLSKKKIIKLPLSVFCWIIFVQVLISNFFV